MITIIIIIDQNFSVYINKKTKREKYTKKKEKEKAVTTDKIEKHKINDQERKEKGKQNSKRQSFCFDWKISLKNEDKKY